LKWSFLEKWFQKPGLGEIDDYSKLSSSSEKLSITSSMLLLRNFRKTWINGFTTTIMCYPTVGIEITVRDLLIQLKQEKLSKNS